MYAEQKRTCVKCASSYSNRQRMIIQSQMECFTMNRVTNDVIKGEITEGWGTLGEGDHGGVRKVDIVGDNRIFSLLDNKTCDTNLDHYRGQNVEVFHMVAVHSLYCIDQASQRGWPPYK